jgi:hypothetical protein
MKIANGVGRTLLLAAFGISILAPARGFAQATEGAEDSGAVFVMTNGVDKNEIIAFRRNDDGTLQETRRLATDGRGSGGNVDPPRLARVLGTQWRSLSFVCGKCGERGAFNVLR